MKRDDLTFAVVIRTFNRLDSLPRAIQSLINQRQKPQQIIIVDDGSSDGTIEYLNDLDIEGLELCIHEINLGAAAAFNSGIKRAKTDLVAFLDSDDEFLPDFIFLMKKEFENNPEIGFSYCRLIDGPKWSLQGCGKYPEALRQFHISAMGTLVINRNVVNRIPLLPSRDQVGAASDMCEDDRLCFELSKKYCFSHLPIELYKVVGNGRTRSSEVPLMVAAGWGKLFIDYSEDLLKYLGNFSVAKNLSKVLALCFLAQDRDTPKLVRDKILTHKKSNFNFFILYLYSFVMLPLYIEGELQLTQKAIWKIKQLANRRA